MRPLFTFSLALLILLVFTVGCGKRKTWKGMRDRADRRAIPKVPYIVNPKSRMPEVVLWRNSGRTDKKGIARVPKGTKCTILKSKDVDRTRGATMYKVKAVTGEVGWIPQFCIEYRKKYNITCPE